MPKIPPLKVSHTCAAIDSLIPLVRRNMKGADRREAYALLEQLRGAHADLRQGYADTAAALHVANRMLAEPGAPVRDASGDFVDWPF